MESDLMAEKSTTSRKKEPGPSKPTTFECNICFDEVNEPVVTRCGHLFCWSCLLSWMNRRNYHCPMCNAGISREKLIPLYGHGRSQVDPRKESEEPRPKAERPRSTQSSHSFFRGYEGGLSISFGLFPFSFVFPFGLWSSNTGGSLLNFFGINRSTADMTPEQRRAYTNSLYLILVGILMLGYLIFYA